MRGHKRYRAGAWRLIVFAGTDPLTGRRRNLDETVSAPNNSAGAKAADARLAELVAAVESGRTPSREEAPEARANGGGARYCLTGGQPPRRDPRSGEWIGWSPKTAKTLGDNFRFHLLPAIGAWSAQQVTGLHLDRLY
jgi:hypothetical protein